MRPFGINCFLPRCRGLPFPRWIGAAVSCSIRAVFSSIHDSHSSSFLSGRGRLVSSAVIAHSTNISILIGAFGPYRLSPNRPCVSLPRLFHLVREPPLSSFSIRCRWPSLPFDAAHTVTSRWRFRCASRRITSLLRESVASIGSSVFF